MWGFGSGSLELHKKLHWALGGQINSRTLKWTFYPTYIPRGPVRLVLYRSYPTCPLIGTSNGNLCFIFDTGTRMTVEKGRGPPTGMSYCANGDTDEGSFLRNGRQSKPNQCILYQETAGHIPMYIGICAMRWAPQVKRSRWQLGRLCTEAPAELFEPVVTVRIQICLIRKF